MRLGNAVLTRVVETSFEPGVEMFGHTPERAWSDHADLLVPTFVNPDTRRWRVAIQTWVIDVDGLRVLIDTGVGNGRERPAIPVLHHLDTGFLQALTAAGVSPDSVDVVLNTHLHSDHVGWNTMASGGAWVPTFPNARYLLPEADFRYFCPDGPGCDDAARLVFDDSVAPVLEAGQVELFSGEHQLSDSVWLRPAAGHTPGSSVLWLDAGRPAVFVGDLTHCPIQIPRPSDPCAFDVDAAAAAATRKRVFTEAARRRAAVIPAHYPGHGGATLVARGDAFQVDGWLELEPI
ncbi:MBL fold metallo-hydrolase [Mycobacterium adipatum]|jgi:glyoxylase-like metal-dependent hydrolase (beta-lactamase superfamily II)|uniref:MBL fold metallo-hydrolase n=1 Tax=Mycobacterium adipatum TaxID=1682113 RepID=A0A172UHU5_9MYCO|nr:MBL fold metallo-hydrolase [Mycobacterium adipatum]ANE78747.1 MBL fold metallo-hydrolase [Mycobacterium adipatum]MBI5734404.1 MBL fold metallo-hydrolase [Mycolicibacterium neoaurum]